MRNVLYLKRTNQRLSAERYVPHFRANCLAQTASTHRFIYLFSYILTMDSKSNMKLKKRVC